MADVTIATHRWRIRTDEFSPACDNTLKVNNLNGLSDNPFRMNSFGICFPACEICISPYGEFANIADLCNTFSFMKKSADDVVQIPSQWDVTCDGGAFTLARQVVCNLTAAAGSTTNSFLPELAGKSFVMRGGIVGTNGIWSSDFMSLGDRTNLYEMRDKTTGNVLKRYKVIWSVSVKVGFACGRSTNCYHGPFLVFRRSQKSKEVLNMNANFNANEFECMSASLKSPVFGNAATEQTYSVASVAMGLTSLTMTEKTTPGSIPLFTEMQNDVNKHSDWSYRFGFYLCGTVLTFAHNVTVQTLTNGLNAFGMYNCAGRTESVVPDAGLNTPAVSWKPAAAVFQTTGRVTQ